jgi:hypothetical protein
MSCQVFAAVLDAAPVHRFDKRLGPVSRVQSDQVDLAGQNAIQNSPRIVVRHVPLPGMSPPDDHVGPFEIPDGQSLLGVVERDRSKLQIIRRRLQTRDDFVAQKVVVRLRLPRLPLVPDKHVHGVGTECRFTGRYADKNK